MTAATREAPPAPALPAPAPSAASAGRTHQPDSLLTVVTYAVLLVSIPSVYVFKPLGAAGTPATLVGLLALGLWGLRRLVGEPSPRPTPVHWIVLVFLAAMTASFTAGALRPTTGSEFTALWRGMIAVASWIGIALTVMDGFRTRARLERFLRLVVWLGMLLGVLGVLQFLTRIDIVPLLHVPGLTQNADIGGLYERSGFSRVSGTALHSIEYAAVLSMILPLAFGQALSMRTHRVRAWLPVLVIGGALPLTVARSGMLGLGLALGFAFLMMRGRQRVWFLLAVPFLAAALRAAVPGLLGTIASLFTSAGQDISISGRTSDYTAVGHFFDQAPFLGRGLFTFLPSIYRILDNQYLGTLVEAGVAGMLSLILLLAGSAAVAFTRARSLSRAVAAGDPAVSQADHLLPFSIGASLFSAMLLFATFDGFSFPMCMGMFSIVLGASGAAWRLCRPGGVADEQAASAAQGRRGAVVAGVVVAVLAAGALALQTAHPSYDARVSFALAVPPAPGQNIYYAKIGTSGVSDLVRFSLSSPGVRQSLTAAGAGPYTVAIGSGSLGPDTDVLGYGDVMRVSGLGPDPATAQNTAALVVQSVRSQLSAWQDGQGTDAGTHVAVLDAQVPEVFEVPVHRAAGAVGIAALASLAGLVVAALTRPRPRARRGSGGPGGRGPAGAHR